MPLTAKGTDGKGRAMWDKGRQSVEMMRKEASRKSTEEERPETASTRDPSRRNSGDVPLRHTSLDSTGGSSLSLDLNEQICNPCSPWHPCDNGCLRRGKAKRNSGNLEGREERLSCDEQRHSSEDEEDSPAAGLQTAHHSSHVGKQQMRRYRSNIPIAKEGYIESAKKAVNASTVLSGKKRYVSSKRKYARLIPSLGCIAVFKLHSSLVPTKVLQVPPADKIYPKHSIIVIGGKVHVYSIRVLISSKEYTFVCESELARDDWVEQLRTVGEHWKKSCMRHLQLCGVVKTWKDAGFFRKFTKLTSFTEPKDKFMWEAKLAGGRTVQMISMVGRDAEGEYRYDGMVAAATGADKSLRDGRGLCNWNLGAAEREAERDKAYSDMRHVYYDGFWERNRKSGQAMIKFADDSVYEGYHKFSTSMQGYGRMAYADGSWYEGEWHEGCRHGYGYMWWSASNEAHQGVCFPRPF